MYCKLELNLSGYSLGFLKEQKQIWLVSTFLRNVYRVYDFDNKIFSIAKAKYPR